VLRISYADFDALAGFPAGLSGKVFGQGQVRRLGVEKLFDAIRAAGWRLRFEVDPDARKRLRALSRAVDTGEHVDPSKLTVAQWIDQWIDAGAPGRKKKKVGQRTLERYEQLLNTHVNPAIGEHQLQQLRASAIDTLYTGLEGKIAPRTAHHVHVVLGAALGTAQSISTRPP
jgi:Phage integrase, N-terminal SAM-like domain